MTHLFTYGDGVSDINIQQLIEHHKKEGRKATLTAVQPPGRFGSLAFERGRVMKFEEKPPGDRNWINGGFFVLEPDVIELIEGDETTWEAEPLKQLAKQSELTAYNHSGFWQPMDTLRDKNFLEDLINREEAPWVKW